MNKEEPVNQLKVGNSNLKKLFQLQSLPLLLIKKKKLNLNPQIFSCNEFRGAEFILLWYSYLGSYFLACYLNFLTMRAIIGKNNVCKL